MVAIFGFTREKVIAAVQEMYTAVAITPERPFHFPVGREACLQVGYPAGLLEGLAEEALQSFAGVACPFRADVIRAGDTVVDIGAGAGTDTLIASRLVGPRGRDDVQRSHVVAFIGMSNVTVFVDDAVEGTLPAVCARDGVPTDSSLRRHDDVGDRAGLGVAWLLLLAGPIGWLGLVSLLTRPPYPSILKSAT